MRTRPNINEYLKKLGIEHAASVIHNPDYAALFAAETQEHLTGFERVTVTQSGAVAVDTGGSGHYKRSNTQFDDVFHGVSPDEFVVLFCSVLLIKSSLPIRR
ncbi:hypothetical protein [Dryocola clanedunensis]|uniref:hypothetical protein n=1 Tax=Cedecea sulfonylureivorans TaxID=3051154 RepID=UPI001926A1DA|nr:hypothetical protein [Cedecea sulfonylureivorans]